MMLVVLGALLVLAVAFERMRTALPCGHPGCNRWVPFAGDLCAVHRSVHRESPETDRGDVLALR